MTFYGSQFIDNRLPEVGTEVKVDGLSRPAIVNSDGMYIYGNDGKKVSSENIATRVSSCACVCVCVQIVVGN